MRDLQLLAYRDAKAIMHDAFTETYVRLVLERAGQNISKAARFAGMSRASFYKLIRKVRENPELVDKFPEPELSVQPMYKLDDDSDVDVDEEPFI